MTMLIDCHVLTMQGDNAAWRDELRRDLDAEPVRQHWLPGIAGELGRARAAGLEAGDAPFVSWADPDDRIIRGTYGRLLQALQAQPQAPFAWAGEQRVDDDLTPIGQPSVWPGGYDQRRHRNHIFGFCHGVVLIRRAALAPAMPLLRRCGNGAEGILLARLAAIGAPMAPGHQPVHLPIVGRLWRQHPGQYHRAFSPADRAHGHRALGIDPQYLHGSRQASAPCATCGPPR